MDKKFINGLANQVMSEFENIKILREDFINCGAQKEHIDTLKETMKILLDIYFILTDKNVEE